MTTTTPNLVPTIESTALPSTPAEEWAESTHNMLAAHKSSTPLEMPGPPVPGSFPEEPAPERSGETLVDTAKTYLPAQDDVQRAMTNAGQAAKAYLPQSVASYLPSTTETMVDLAPPHPPSEMEELAPPRPAFATDDTGLSNLSTEAQAGSIPPMPDSASTLSVTGSATDPTNLSTRVHTGTSASLHPVTPLEASPASKFVEGIPTPPAHTESPAPLSTASSSNGFRTPDVSSSGQSEGIPAPPNSKATTADFDAEALGGGVPDALPPPAPHGILGSAALNSSDPKDNFPMDTPPARGADAAPNFPESTETEEADAGGEQKKPKLVERLKGKMHIGHAHA